MTQHHFTHKDCKAWQAFFLARGAKVETLCWWCPCEYSKAWWPPYDYAVDGYAINVQPAEGAIPAYTPDDIVRGLRAAYLDKSPVVIVSHVGRVVIDFHLAKGEWPTPSFRIGDEIDDDYDIFAALNALRKKIDAEENK